MDKRPLLEDLANNAFQTGGAQKARKRLMSIEELRTFRYISDCLAQVAGVFDRYISFVSLIAYAFLIEFTGSTAACNLRVLSSERCDTVELVKTEAYMTLHSTQLEERVMRQ